MRQTKNQNKKVIRKQPKKDSKSKRINFDNERESKFVKDQDKIKDISETRASNDVRWYADNPELLRAAASIPFSTTTGQLIDNIRPDSALRSVPGVMSLSWCPAVGSRSSQAINAAAASIYSFVVHANSRNTAYEAPDLMITILAGGSLFSTIAHAIRAYGTMRYFDQRNAYLPKALISAMGFDYEDLRSNLSQMWFDINELIARSSQIWIPKNLPFVERWFWMNSNIYKDGDSVKAQYYVFTPDCMPNFAQGSSGTRMYLNGPHYNPNPEITKGNWGFRAGNNVTWSQFMEHINYCFTTFLESEDRGTMLGDILKAYGAENIYALTPIDVNYMIQPQFDKEVLTQIENAIIFNNVPDYFAQYNSTGIIPVLSGTYLDPDTKKTTNITPESRTDALTNSRIIPDVSVLNFHTMDIPSPEQVMVATRLKVAGNIVWPSPDNYTKPGVSNLPEVVGTEYLTSMIIITNSYSDSAYSLDIININQCWNADAPANLDVRRQFALWCAFDWAPWLYSALNIVETYPTQPTASPYTGSNAIYPIPNVGYDIGDWEQWTTIDKQTLSKMHRTALYSEFGVPVI